MHVFAAVHAQRGGGFWERTDKGEQAKRLEVELRDEDLTAAEAAIVVERAPRRELLKDDEGDAYPEGGALQ